jgi:TolB-like protein
MHRTYLAIIAALLSVILYLALSGRSETPEYIQTATVPTPSVVVLPFVVIGSGGDARDLGTSLAADVSRHLSAVHGFSPAHDGNGKPMGRYLLEGSVSRRNGSLRVVAQLIDVTTDAHLWSNTYEHGTADTAIVTKEIADAVARRVIDGVI